MRRAALAVCLAVAVALWVTAWLSWLATFAVVPAPSYLAFGAYAATAALFGWMLARWRVPTAAGQIANGLLAIGLGWATLRTMLPPPAEAGLAGGLVDMLGRVTRGDGAAWVLILVLAGLWTVSLRLGTSRQTDESVRRSARTALLAVALLAGVTALSRPVDLSLPLAAGSVVVILALVLAQIVHAGSDPYTVSSGVGGTGLALLVVAMTGLGAAALAVAGALQLAAGQALLAPFVPVAEKLRDILAWILAGLFTVAYGIGTALFRALVWLSGAATDVPPPTPEPTAPPTPVSDLLAGADGRWGVWLFGLALLAALALVIGWLARAYRRYNDTRPGEGAVERTSALGLGRVWRDAFGLARGLWAGVAGAVGRVRARPSGVRALYAELLAAAAERGHPRSAPVTPYEYEPEAGEALPEALPALGDLTAAYVAARYGDRPPSAAELARLRQQWRQARGSMADRSDSTQP